MILDELNIRYDDSKNRIAGYDIFVGNYSKSVDYVYGGEYLAPDIVSGVKLNNSQLLTYGYDWLNRLSTRTINATSSPYVTQYTYFNGATPSQTTTLIETVKNGNDTLKYTYDNLGNIVKVEKNGTIIEVYEYDSLGQLVYAEVPSGRYDYTYDNGGNITGVVYIGEEWKAFTYGNSEWKDLLTSYNGQTITYDTIGNPLTYYNGSTFTWSDGRRLTNVSNGTNTYSYQYDESGYRVSKTVNGNTTVYHWLDGRLQAEETNTYLLVYHYDENGSRVGFTYKTNASEANYYYIYNLQGNVIEIINSAGTVVVQYTYDPWGKITAITGTEANTIGTLNPIRYRGYYYDTETGFYYCTSRYYDPEIGRWINADGQIAGVGGEVLGYNVFAYCMNNPVNLQDETGNWPRWITAAVTVVAAVVTVAAAVTGNLTVAAVAAKVTIAATVTLGVQTWHYDARASKNKGMDEMTYDEAVAIPGADPNVSDSFHDFSGDNKKVCLEDGREGIYDSSGEYVDDPRDIGTYNYFVPKGFWSGAAHIAVDVFPYIIFGNNDNDPGLIVNFPEKWANNLIALFE